MRNQVFRFTTSEEDLGLRLDQVLPRYCAELSRSRARQIIDLGGVHIAGRRARQCSQETSPGSAVEVFIDGQPLEPWSLSREHVLYQDNFILVVNKPAGVETQPTPARYKGTLYQALQVFLGGVARGGRKPDIGMVQRLDRGTSGVMVFSIHPRAHRGLTEEFAGRQACKNYLALVSGVPGQPQGEIRSQLARGRKGNLMKSVERGGKEAITRYRVLTSWQNGALLEVTLLTGRSHQIRAHLSEAGHPLLGDERYGGPAGAGGIPLGHPMLHAARLSFRHPVEGCTLDFSAPLPDDWFRVWAGVGKSPGELDRIMDNLGNALASQNLGGNTSEKGPAPC